MAIAEDATTPTGRAPMTRSEAARHAALVRYGKEQPLSFAQRLAAVQERRKLAKQKAKAGKGKAKGAKPKDPAIAARQAERDKERAADRAARLQRQATRDAEHQQDRTARQERQAAADAQRAADRGARQQAQAQRQAEKEKAQKEKAKAKASAGAGAGKPKQRAAASAAQDRAERAQRIAGRVQDLALARGAAGAAVSDRQLAELADAGLVEVRGGAATLTEAGAARIGGHAGQPVGKQPAGQDRTAQNGPTEDAPAPEQGPTAQALADAERAGAQAAQRARRQSKRHQRRRQSTIANLTATVDEGKAMSLTDWLTERRAERKAQTDQERAMFANMGRSKGGGGAGPGGKPTGGQGGLWPKGKDGKRHAEGASGGDKGDAPKTREEAQDRINKNAKEISAVSAEHRDLIRKANSTKDEAEQQRLYDKADVTGARLKKLHEEREELNKHFDRLHNEGVASARAKTDATIAKQKYDKLNAEQADLYKASVAARNHAQERGISPAEKRRRQDAADKAEAAYKDHIRSNSSAMQQHLRDIEDAGYRLGGARGERLVPTRGNSTAPRQGFNPAGYKKDLDLDEIKMTLAPDLLSALNDQITRERYAEASYTAIAAWADAQSFPGLTAWATKSAAEERQHAQRQIGYLNDRARATLQPVDAPETEFGGYAQALQHALELERTVSQALTDLARQARDAGDIATAVFVETFLPEQVDAEKQLSIYLQRVGRGAPIDLLDSELYEEAG